jgi:apolipoprotein D and lipocalin family protein
VTLSRLTAALALSVAVGLGACATSIPASQVRAPQPTKPIDLERFYSGQWLEVARLPMRITDGCVAATTDYVIVSPTRVDLRDACRQGGIDGRERAVGAAGVILDPGFNAKLRAPYFGGLLTWEYWVLDRADDYSWFISTDPTFHRLFIYTRDVPSAAEIKALTDRARALGYDVSRLEYPALPAR